MLDTNGIKSLIRDVPDFPKPGILFRDITTLLRDPEGLESAVHAMAEPFAGDGIEAVVGVEARGFILGAPVAMALGCGFIPIRKAGKLPAATIGEQYDLEYGQACVEVHRDALHRGQRVIILDDVLATGGTMGAACNLMARVGAEIAGLSFLVELKSLGGRAGLSSHRIESVVIYD